MPGLVAALLYARRALVKVKRSEGDLAEVSRAVMLAASVFDCVDPEGFITIGDDDAPVARRGRTAKAAPAELQPTPRYALVTTLLIEQAALLQEASARYRLLETECGVIKLDDAEVVEDGRIAAHITPNGRVWEGPIDSWRDAKVLIYNPAGSANKATEATRKCSV
jgi:hypothetical protein